MAKKQSARRRPLPPSPLSGERMRKRRLALGMSQADLAQVSGVREKFISPLETGHGSRHVYDFVLVALARGLKTSMDYLCGLTDDPEPPTPAKKARAS